VNIVIRPSSWLSAFNGISRGRISEVLLARLPLTGITLLVVPAASYNRERTNEQTNVRTRELTWPSYPFIEFPRRRQFRPSLFPENSIKIDRLAVEIGRVRANRMRIDDISAGLDARLFLLGETSI